MRAGDADSRPVAAMVPCRSMPLPATASLSTIDRSGRAWQQVYTALRNAIVAVELATVFPPAS